VITLILFFAMLQDSVAGDSQKANFQDLLREGRQALEQKDFAGALKKLSRAWELDEKKPELLNLLGLAHFQLMDYSKARGFFERSLALDKSNPYTWMTLGHVFYEEGRFAMAVEHYEKALSLDPGYGEAAHFRDQLLGYGSALRACRHRHILLVALLVAELLATGLLVWLFFRKSKESPPCKYAETPG
jgi:Flp pilus assembly protein TadD